MRLPNGDRAIIDRAKLTDYWLNLDHPRGRHKARVFKSVLDITAADAQLLSAALADAARDREAIVSCRQGSDGEELLDRAKRRNRTAFCDLFRVMRTGMAEMEMFSVVAVLRDMPEQKLVRGQVGTVVEQLAPEVYLVDFCDQDGHTYALATLRSHELILLHHRPIERVA